MKKDTLIKLTSFILAVILIIGFFIYSSYAYLSMKVEGTGTENKAVSKNSFDVTYSQSSNISLTNASLINDADKASEASLSKFSVTLNDLDSAEYSVSLTNLYVSSNFQSSYVKWELINTDNNNVLNSGSFSSCTGCSNGSYQSGTATKTLLSKSSSNKLTKNKKVNLGLRVWLSDAGSSVNQNSLASGSLSGKIDVSVYYTT